MSVKDRLPTLEPTAAGSSAADSEAHRADSSRSGNASRWPVMVGPPRGGRAGCNPSVSRTAGAVEGLAEEGAAAPGCPGGLRRLRSVEQGGEGPPLDDAVRPALAVRHFRLR